MCVSCGGRAVVKEDEDKGSCREEEARVAEEGRLSGEAEAKGEGEGAIFSADLIGSYAQDCYALSMSIDGNVECVVEGRETSPRGDINQDGMPRPRQLHFAPNVHNTEVDTEATREPDQTELSKRKRRSAPIGSEAMTQGRHD